MWEGTWARLAATSRSSPAPTAVLSSELLAAATPAQARAAVASFGDAEVHAVLTVRDLARQLPSGWQEQVKHRQTMSLDQFVAGCLGGDGGPTLDGGDGSTVLAAARPARGRRAVGRGGGSRPRAPGDGPAAGVAAAVAVGAVRRRRRHRRLAADLGARRGTAKAPGEPGRTRRWARQRSSCCAGSTRATWAGSRPNATTRWSGRCSRRRCSPGPASPTSPGSRCRPSSRPRWPAGPPLRWSSCGPPATRWRATSTSCRPVPPAEAPARPDDADLAALTVRAAAGMITELGPLERRLRARSGVRVARLRTERWSTPRPEVATTEPGPVFIHIGAPKTGTTFLQDVLWHHRADLAARGVLFTRERYDEHYRASLDLRGSPRQPQGARRHLGPGGRPCPPMGRHRGDLARAVRRCRRGAGGSRARRPGPGPGACRLLRA